MGTSFISQNVALGKHQDLILGGPSATFSFFFFRKAKKLFDKLVVTLEIHVILLKLCTMCVRRNTKSIKKFCQIVLDTYTELY